jgi:hypothetical protein
MSWFIWETEIVRLGQTLWKGFIGQYHFSVKQMGFNGRPESSDCGRRVTLSFDAWPYEALERGLPKILPKRRKNWRCAILFSLLTEYLSQNINWSNHLNIIVLYAKERMLAPLPALKPHHSNSRGDCLGISINTKGGEDYGKGYLIYRKTA